MPQKRRFQATPRWLPESAVNVQSRAAVVWDSLQTTCKAAVAGDCSFEIGRHLFAQLQSRHHDHDLNSEVKTELSRDFRRPILPSRMPQKNFI